MILQKEITLHGFKRGYHLITRTIIDNLEDLPEKGLLHILVKHTSAAIALNENADPSVRALEGGDDMPAHLKSSVFGQSLTIPITNKRLNLGTWQGIYFCEFRNYGGSRTLVLTIFS